MQYMYAIYGLNYFNKRPLDKHLFIEPDFYVWGCLEWYSYAALSSGRLQEACLAYWNMRRIVNLDAIPQSAKEKILFNEKFFPNPETFKAESDPTPPAVPTKQAAPLELLPKLDRATKRLIERTNKKNKLKK